MVSSISRHNITQASVQDAHSDAHLSEPVQRPDSSPPPIRSSLRASASPTLQCFVSRTNRAPARTSSPPRNPSPARPAVGGEAALAVRAEYASTPSAPSANPTELADLPPDALQEIALRVGLQQRWKMRAVSREFRQAAQAVESHVTIGDRIDIGILRRGEYAGSVALR
uniref:F-box protein n=1 Tax=Paraburkholderia terricola TaxID=169427 RepID=UPI0035B55998